MLKRLPMIMICVRRDDRRERDFRQIRRGAAGQQYDESGKAHDRRVPRNRSAAAFPDGPDKRHVCTPLQFSMILWTFWLADNEFFVGGAAGFFLMPEVPIG